MGNTQNRVAVITGGASGIGFAAASRCIEELNMKVVIADFDVQNLNEATEKLKVLARKAGHEKPSSRVLGMKCDVTKKEDYVMLANGIFTNKNFGEVGFLFLNAGMSIGTSVINTSVEVLKKQIDVNVYGVWHGIHAFVPAMVAQPHESVICATSSFAGLLNTSTLGIGAGAPYTISKHAVTLTMEALQHELRSMANNENGKVRAHVLCPAAVNTNYNQAALKNNGMEDNNALGGAMQQMQSQSMQPERLVELLSDGILKKKSFYIKGYDFGQPHEMLNAMLKARMEDIVHERNPLSHLVRDEEGTKVRKSISSARKVGMKILADRGKL